MNKTLSNIFKGDKVVWMVFFFLCMISIVEVFSASSGLTYKSGSYWAPVLKHVGLLSIGLFMMVLVLNIPCKYFKIVTPFLMPAALVMLLVAMLVGVSTNGAQRWISILGIQFQPSEIAKGGVVLTVAQILGAMQTETGAARKTFRYILWISIPYIALIFRENFSTAALLAFVVVCMMFIGRVSLKQIGKLLGVVTILGVLFVASIMLLGTDRNRENTRGNVTERVEQQQEASSHGGILTRLDTWKSRIMKFMDKREVPPEDFDLDKDAQIAHSNIAIVSSNVVGVGPGNSVERDFLSQAFSDFIYAIIIEELGIAGAAFVAMLYIILLFRVRRIANRCENNFPAFLVMGLALLLVSQALFNMLVAVGLAPVTGQPLPLISKGGTSTIINCIYIGVILSVSRSAKKKDMADAE